MPTDAEVTPPILKQDIRMTESIIVALITAGIPSIATIITAISANRQSRRAAAKQTILQMCMEDEFNWELFRKLPMNYDNIQNEYKAYHKVGGNGEVTKRVNEYNKWYDSVEDAIAKAQIREEES